MEHSFHSPHKLNIARAEQQESNFLQAFRYVPGCQTCMCKRGIRLAVAKIVLKF